MDIAKIELELKKRILFPYKWGRKQSDEWDVKTNFIYKTQTLDDLLAKTEDFETELSDYAMNRWYNFTSAVAIESIFCKHPDVTAHKNNHDKLIDFNICGIPFDHKTSVYPMGYHQQIDYALKHREDLIRWFYKNQSQQGRLHFKNRIFIVLYDYKYGAHWKLKSHLTEIGKRIDHYLTNFDPHKLCQLNFGAGAVYTDIIWYVYR